MKANDSHIYCDNCKEIRPLLRDFMPANEKNGHAATDLICMVCAFVIATIHHISPTDVEIGKARQGPA